MGEGYGVMESLGSYLRLIYYCFLLGVLGLWKKSSFSVDGAFFFFCFFLLELEYYSSSLLNPSGADRFLWDARSEIHTSIHPYTLLRFLGLRRVFMLESGVSRLTHCPTLQKRSARLTTLFLHLPTSPAHFPSIHLTAPRRRSNLIAKSRSRNQILQACLQFFCMDSTANCQAPPQSSYTKYHISYHQLQTASKRIAPKLLFAMFQSCYELQTTHRGFWLCEADLRGILKR